MPLRKCWIIEDEPPAMRRLINLLEAVAPGIEVVFTADSLAATRRALITHDRPDFILSDIHLADGLSLDLWEEDDPGCPIIFTTAYDEYGIRAFRTNSIDYLMKPVAEPELERALGKLRRLRGTAGHHSINQLNDLAAMLRGQQPSYRRRFLGQRGQELVPVRDTELSQLYSEDGITFAFGKDRQRLMLTESLDRLEQELDPAEWFRINRAQIVRLDTVVKAAPYFNYRLALELRPDAGLENIVARAKVAACKGWLGT